MEETRRLARFVCDSRYEDVPEGVRHEALRSLLNWLGCAIGGCRHETVERALAALAPFAGPPQATLLGRGGRMDILHASLINGMGSHVFDFDDTHLRTIIHPSGPVAPALLALSEYRTMSGAALVHAFILGVEVECRIGNAVYPSHYDVGWHITGTAGVFGAAAAAGRALGLDPQRMTWALGIAATQAAGLREMFGTMCKPFHPGRAAQSGLAAALMAAEGFTSSDRAIEAPRGFAQVLAAERNLKEITDRLGETWELALNTYKPFACGIVIHPVIDGCIQLRSAHGLSGDEIEAVSLRVHPLVLELTGKKTPQTGLEGKFSVYHSAAISLLFGAAGESGYSDAVVRDARVLRLRERVNAEADPAVREDEAGITIRLRDGRTLEKTVDHAVGSLARPLSDKAIEEKFRSLADGILPPEQAEAVIRLCWSLERVPDAGALARQSAPAGGSADREGCS